MSERNMLCKIGWCHVFDWHIHYRCYVVSTYIPILGTNQHFPNAVLVVWDACESLQYVQRLRAVTELRDTPETTTMINWEQEQLLRVNKDGMIRIRYPIIQGM